MRKNAAKYRIDSVACRYSWNDLGEQSHAEKAHQSMTKPHLAPVTPTTEIRTVARRSTRRRADELPRCRPHGDCLTTSISPEQVGMHLDAQIAAMRAALGSAMIQP
jgi:hypothetical protein